MKTIVFGGSGFVGSHVADALTEAGHQVTIFDTITSPYLQKKQKMMLGDIIDIETVTTAIKGMDIVYHFAGMADIETAHIDPLKTIESNILGTTVILEACRKNKVKRFIFASTIYVYSNSGSFYRSSKQACELIIENYNEVFNIPYTILRYGSLYGPRAKENNWINKILTQALTTGKITRHGDGEEIREYINVKDAAHLSVEILAKDYENQNVIITGQQPMKIKDLLVMVNEILGNDITIEYIPADSTVHYEITPYCFKPKAGKKLVSTRFYDLGQGLLECLAEINAEVNNKNGIVTHHI
jgi:UDP-glucose 4-epimerase